MTPIGSAPDSLLSVEQLIEAARGGSREALGRLMEKWRPYLLLTASGALDSDLQAKVGASDIVQETLLKAHHDFANFHGRTQGELLAWLRRILVNSAADVSRHYVGTDMRALSREIRLEPNDQSGNFGGHLPAASRTPYSEASNREEVDRIDKALKRLPEHYRVILRLRQHENRSFADIGRLIDRTPDAARKLWFRAVERLRLDLGLNHEDR